MHSTGVLVLRGTRGRCPRLVGDLLLRLLVSLVDSPIVRGLVGFSLHLKDFRLQQRVLLQLVEFLSSPIGEVVLVLLLPLRHQPGT